MNLYRHQTSIIIMR